MKKKTVATYIIGALVLGQLLLSTGCSRIGEPADTSSLPQATTAASEEAEQTSESEELTAEQKLRSKVDIIAREMTENGNFSEEDIRFMKEWKLNPNALYDFRDMNEEQMKEYVKRAGQVNRYLRWIGLGYLRIRAEVLGKMSADAPRLTVEALEGLIRESHSRKELYDNIKSQYGEPDFVFDTEANAVGAEYWLNNEGTEFFLLAIKGGLENGHVAQIALGHYNSEKGSNEGDLLYSTDALKALYGEK